MFRWNEAVEKIVSGMRQLAGTRNNIAIPNGLRDSAIKRYLETNTLPGRQDSRDSSEC